MGISLILCALGVGSPSGANSGNIWPDIPLMDRLTSVSETLKSVAWSPPGRGITEDLGPTNLRPKHIISLNHCKV